MAPVLSIIVSIKDSQADDKLYNAPCTLFPIVSAILFKSSSTPVIWSRRGTILSDAVRKALKAATLRLSVISSVEFRSIPCSFNLCNPSTNSGNVLTGPPRACANLPLPSAKFSNIFRVAVADMEASNPASASLPNKANVSSIVKLKALATGPTMGIAV